MTKNQIKLSIVLLILNLIAFQCHKDTIQNSEINICDENPICTKIFKSIVVTLKDKSQQPTSIDLLEIKDQTKVIRSFQNITSSTVFAIVDDSMLGKEIPKGQNKTLTVVGAQKGIIRFSVTYEISADCCHINYDSGPLDINF